MHPITLGPLNAGDLFICGKAPGHCILYIYIYIVYAGGSAALFTSYDALGIVTNSF